MATIPTIVTNATFVSVFARNATLDIVKVLTGALFYGIYLVLLSSAISILCRREGKQSAKMGLLTALLVMFAMSSFEFWGIVLLCFRSIQNVLINNIEVSYAEKQMAYIDGYARFGSAAQVTLPLEVGASQPLSQPQTRVYLICFKIVLGDAVVLWRVWELYQENRRLTYIPIPLLLGTTVSSVGFFGCYAWNDWPISNHDTCSNLEISAFSLSMATNLSATLVIGYKVWIYRRAMKAYLYQCRHRTRAEKVLVLLLESGFIYSILWIIQLIIILLPPVKSFSGKVLQQTFAAASIQLVRIYPTSMVVLIYLQQSVRDPTGTLSAKPAPESTSTFGTIYDISGRNESTLTSKIA
ncbi:hypothetical protein PM082_014386 [Marasmius tenuissimus]|nr:hypothetical protein PM082_014386 [Marasmius tenuissimus]